MITKERAQYLLSITVGRKGKVPTYPKRKQGLTDEEDMYVTMLLGDYAIDTEWIDVLTDIANGRLKGQSDG